MANETSILMDEVHRKIGRNLLRFQQIEAGLKVILPLIHPDGSAKGIEGLRTFQEIVTTKTLGMLVKDFDHAIKVTPDVVMQHLKMSVAARNQLVHHFFQVPGVDLVSSSGIREAIAYLDKQFEEANAFLTLVQDIAFSALIVLRHNYLNDNPELCRLTNTIIADGTCRS